MRMNRGIGMLSKACKNCCINQIVRLKNLLDFDETTFEVLDNCPKDWTTPQVMRKIWQIACEYHNIKNPYADIKHYYNHLLLNQYDALKQSVQGSFNKALKLAISGNLIDFAASHSFNEVTLVQY